MSGGAGERSIYINGRGPLIPGTAWDNLLLPWEWRSEEPPRATFLKQWQALGQPAGLLDEPATTLSQGQRQMIAVLRALALTPQVMLWDEADSGLDRGSREKLWQLLSPWWADGRAVVAVSHGTNLWQADGSIGTAAVGRRGAVTITNDRCGAWP